MYPHERSLVNDLPKDQVAILGINSDLSPAKLRVVIKRERLIWPIIYDEGGQQGPIAMEWRVARWPTIYVLDAAGIIRFKDLRGDSLIQAVRQLLSEMRTSGKH